MIILFWSFIALVFWAYAGYPLSMYLIAKYKGSSTNVDRSIEPPVSIILALANASSTIYKKLENTFDTAYPLSKIEVIVVMDGYCQETEDEIIRFLDYNQEFHSNLFILNVKKGGKEAAQAAGVGSVVSDGICIFTDVATTLTPNTIHQITKNFADKSVGAVDGMSKIAGEEHSNEGAYLKYENKIREWESKSCGLVTNGGCLFAARTSILQSTKDIHGKEYRGFVPDLQSDFRTALVAKTFGYKTILDKEAVALYTDGKPENEYGRKHRTVVRGINTFMHNLHLLNPFKYGLFSYAFFCHKLLKWLVPFFMIGAFITNFALGITTPLNMFWVTIFILQMLFYNIAIFNLDTSIGKLIRFFVISNIAIFFAWISYIKGERFVFWEPTKR